METNILQCCYSLFINCSFDRSKSSHNYEDVKILKPNVKILLKSFWKKKYSAELVNYETNEIFLLTKEEKKSYHQKKFFWKNCYDDKKYFTIPFYCTQGNI